MHRCLEIKEISLILYSLLCDSDLLSVALACKHFKELALRTLWTRAEFYRILPFLRLFPRDAWCFQEIDGRSLMVPTRELSPVDWSTPARYAPFVRRVVVFAADLKAPFLQSALTSLKAPHLLPDLRELCISMVDVDLFIPFLKVMLAPSLTTLRLHSTGSPEFLEILSCLDCLCPSISSFEIGVKGLSGTGVAKSPIYSVLSKLVCRWPKIRTLKVPVLDVEAFAHLSRLDNFTQLYLDCKTDPGIISGRIYSSFGGFDSLTSLDFYYSHLAPVTKILNLVSTCRLEQMTLNIFHDGESPEEWVEYFKAVARRASSSNVLKLYILGYDWQGHGDGILGSNALRPLFARNLVYFRFNTRYHLDLSDRDVEEIAKACPNITTLDINTDHPRVPGLPPRLTLNAYRHMFIHCPKLDTLGLIIDTDTNLVAHINQDIGDFKKRGRDFTLWVGNSAVKDPLKLASFLLPFFSKAMWSILTCFEEEDPDPVAEGWKQVQNLLTELIAVRDSVEEESGVGSAN